MFLSALFWISLVFAQEQESNLPTHVTAEIVSETESVQAGGKTTIGIHFQIEKGWHLYWKNPGDSGDPPRVSWQLPKGVEAGKILWPVPTRISVGKLANFGYGGDLLLMVPLSVSRNGATIRHSKLDLHARVKWLVCRDICIPGHADLTLSLPVLPKAKREKPRPSVASGLFEEARRNLPIALPKAWEVLAEANSSEFLIKVRAAGEPLSLDSYFFPDIPDQIENGILQRVSGGSDQPLQIRIKKSDQFNQSDQSSGRLRGLLKVGLHAYEVDLPVSQTLSELQGLELQKTGSLLYQNIFLLQALVMAFLGGLILNLMPCVFPVLFIKALSLVNQVSEGDKRAIKIHSLFYTFGIIFSFWLFAGLIFLFQAGGSRLGWGFQLQSPTFVSLLASVLFVFALNLFGVFEMGTSLMGFGSQLTENKGYFGSFMTGVLATVVATPCTAPFMGTALGFALSQPSLLVIGTVFTALALGLAAPYCALSLIPNLGKLLPKPGRWMETFRHLMAFPILGTVIWLYWILGIEAGPGCQLRLLIAILILSCAAWAYGRWKSFITKTIVLILVAVAVYGQIFEFNRNRWVLTQSTFWQTFSRERVKSLVAQGKPVFIDFTAAWCITCKVNERIAFTDSVMETMTRKGIVAMKGDWTNSDPEITLTLEEFGRNGVPLYVLYTGKKGRPPIILPQILTPGTVLNAIEQLKSESK